MMQMGLVQDPYLPPLTAEEQKDIYTLVLDLDETLIHFVEADPNNFTRPSANIQRQTNIQQMEVNHEYGGHFLIRPGAREFLEKMSSLFEIVIFTAAVQDYANWVLDNLDTGGWI